MLFICGGQSRTVDQQPETDLPHYPPVIAVVMEDEAYKIDELKKNIIEPFVVRLSDKDLVKVIALKKRKNKHAARPDRRSE